MLKEIIKKAGYKLTKPRTKVLEVFEGEHKFMTVKEIHSILKGEVDLTSIYRTVILFEKLNILHEERVSNSFAYCLAGGKHHHIICRDCGYTECLPCNHIFQNVKNFSQVSHELRLSGVCRKCSF